MEYVAQSTDFADRFLSTARFAQSLSARGACGCDRNCTLAFGTNTITNTMELVRAELRKRGFETQGRPMVLPLTIRSQRQVCGKHLTN